jgi:hypothetical protein
MADDEHEYLRRVHGYIATVSTVGWPGFTMRSRASDCRGWNSASGVSAASQSNRCTHSAQFSEALSREEHEAMRMDGQYFALRRSNSAHLGCFPRIRRLILPNPAARTPRAA